MIQLIVEDAGERRGFRIGEGTLTVGAGPEAKLRLDAPDVAAIHADIEVQGGRVILRPRPGVMRPVVGGVPTPGPIELHHDEPVEIGGARLTAHYPEGSTLRETAHPAAPATGPVGPGGPIGARGAARPVISPGKATRQAHSRQRKTKGAWFSVGIIAGVVALASGVVFFVGPQRVGQTAASFEPAARLGAARRLLTRGEESAALAELDAIPTAELTPELSAQVAALRQEIEQGARERDRDVHNRLGDTWKREHIESFEQFFLRGTPAPGAIRYYLELLAHFAAEWPEHPEMDWVRRMQERYAGSASLDQPPTFDDVAFKVRFYTESDPKDWVSAFEAIGDFLRTTQGSGRAAADQLNAETLAARQAWFQEKLAQAAAEEQRGNAGQAVAWLVRIVVYAGDAEMADRAAQQLIAREDLAGHLRGYRSHAPEEYEVLAAHRWIADYLRQHPLD